MPNALLLLLLSGSSVTTPPVEEQSTVLGLLVFAFGMIARYFIKRNKDKVIQWIDSISPSGEKAKADMIKEAVKEAVAEINKMPTKSMSSKDADEIRETISTLTAAYNKQLADERAKFDKQLEDERKTNAELEHALRSEMKLMRDEMQLMHSDYDAKLKDVNERYVEALRSIAELRATHEQQLREKDNVIGSVIAEKEKLQDLLALTERSAASTQEALETQRKQYDQQVAMYESNLQAAVERISVLEDRQDRQQDIDKHVRDAVDKLVEVFSDAVQTVVPSQPSVNTAE